MKSNLSSGLAYWIIDFPWKRNHCNDKHCNLYTYEKFNTTEDTSPYMCMIILWQTEYSTFKNLIKFLWLMWFHFSLPAAKFFIHNAIKTMPMPIIPWENENRAMLLNASTSSTNNNKIQFLLIQSKIKCISLDELRCVERMMTLCALVSLPFPPSSCSFSNSLKNP